MRAASASVGLLRQLLADLRPGRRDRDGAAFVAGAAGDLRRLPGPGADGRPAVALPRLARRAPPRP